MRSCLECTGDLQKSDCGQSISYLASAEVAQPCPVLIDDPLCYVSYSRKSHNSSAIIERGCIAKNRFREWMEPMCSRSMLKCSFCKGDNCNYFLLDKEEEKGVIELLKID